MLHSMPQTVNRPLDKSLNNTVLIYCGWDSPFPLSDAGKELPGVLALSDASWLQAKRSSHLWREAVESLWTCAIRFMLSYDVVTHVILVLVGNIFWVCTSMFLRPLSPGINSILFSRGSQQFVSLTFFSLFCCVHMEGLETGSTSVCYCEYKDVWRPGSN